MVELLKVDVYLPYTTEKQSQHMMTQTSHYGTLYTRKTPDPQLNITLSLHVVNQISLHYYGKSDFWSIAYMYL